MRLEQISCRYTAVALHSCPFSLKENGTPQNSPLRSNRKFALTLALATLLAVSPAFAQNYAAPGPPPDPFATLADQPATHSGITFDKNMMGIAQSVLQSSGLDEKRAAAAVTGISYDMYHYARPAFYTPEAMNALLAGYKAAGWKHLVNANQTAANTAQPEKPVTDLWLHFSGVDIDAVTVLTRAPKTMNVVRITGDLRPLDLLHLSGHLGIPKVDPSAVMVPDRN